MNVLVTGGGTVAPIDDVRTITNVSTGRFAAAISECSLARGCTVWHLHAPSAALPLHRQAVFPLDTPDAELELERIRGLHADWLKYRQHLHLMCLGSGTVGEYSETLHDVLSSNSIDIAFLAMAVSDFVPIPTPGKLSSRADELIVRCRPAPKVIRSVRDWAPSIFLVGFKLLSGVSEAELIRQAEASRQANRADLVVANDLQTLAAEAHTVHLIRAGHPPETLAPGPDLADRLVERVLGWATGKSSAR
jgi:phosphopantothenate-cysteine ligase